MMNRRNTLLALSAALALALPVVASAQTSRVEGMALQGDYIKDYSSIFTYTSSVANVGNLVYGELGRAPVPINETADRGVGAVLGNLWDGRLGVWSIHVREQTPELGQGDASSSGATGSNASDPNTNAMESFDVMWAKKFGTKSFGLRLNRSYGKREFTGGANGAIGTEKFDDIAGATATDANFHRNVLGIGGGVGFEMSPTTNVETNFLYQSRTFSLEDTTGTVLAEEDSPTTYQFAARAMWQWQPNVMVVPVFKWYSYDLSTKAGAVVVQNTLKGWQVGAAGNWALGSNDLFVLGVTFARNTFEVGNQATVFTETFAPQVFAALETHLNSWLTVRFGANKGAWYTFEDKDNTVPNSTKITGNDGTAANTFNMNLGAGVKFGNLQVDAILNDNFPHNLPHFISGNTTGNIFPKVTATYPW